MHTMIEFQIVSDLHLEAPKSYDVFDIEPQCPNLALLGDIGYLAGPQPQPPQQRQKRQREQKQRHDHRDDYLAFLRRHLARFRVVFLVLGNHEPWHSSWDEAREAVRRFEAEVREERRQQQGAGNPTATLGEFVLLNQTRYDFPSVGSDDDEGVVVLGCTLFSRVPTPSIPAVSLGVQDFYLTGGDWTVERHSAAFERDLAWLNGEVERIQLLSPQKRIVVFTHHSPTLDARAVDPRYRDSSMGSGFATDLKGEACWRSVMVRLWAFGHTHWNCDFMDEGDGDEGTGIGTETETGTGKGKRVLANQRGYYHNQSEGYDEGRVVRV